MRLFGKLGIGNFVFALLAVFTTMFASPPQDARAGLHCINYIANSSASNKFTMYFDSTGATVDSVFSALTTNGGYIGSTRVRYAELDTNIILSSAGKYVYGVQGSVYGSPDIVTPTVAVLDLGAPIALSTSGVKALHKLPTTGTDTITTAIGTPDVPRTISVTGNVSGITGNVYVFAPVDGVSTKITLALSGTSTVTSTVAINGVPTKIVYPARHASGDSVSVGFADGIGLGVALKRPSVFLTVENTTPKAASAVTVHNSAVSKAANYIAFYTASDGTRRWVYYVSE